MRQCPFTGCEATVPETMFACRKHWFSLGAQQRREIHEAYADYCEGRSGVTDLRRRQQAVLNQSKISGTA